MATSKTLTPTNVTIQIPAFADKPDQRVTSNCIDKEADAINALSDQIGNRTGTFTRHAVATAVSATEIRFCVPIFGKKETASFSYSSCGVTNKIGGSAGASLVSVLSQNKEEVWFKLVAESNTFTAYDCYAVEITFTMS